MATETENEKTNVDALARIVNQFFDFKLWRFDSFVQVGVNDYVLYCQVGDGEGNYKEDYFALLRTDKLTAYDLSDFFKIKIVD